jgi:hypothetical protein
MVKQTVGLCCVKEIMIDGRGDGSVYGTTPSNEWRHDG